ncbi:hypothetical protein GE21DRAFT_1060875 [Neurospora crassa]|nr:hypothetical protein GE21DRAFT_1060875 [Neurospora crassa]
MVCNHSPSLPWHYTILNCCPIRRMPRQIPFRRSVLMEVAFCPPSKLLCWFLPSVAVASVISPIPCELRLASICQVDPCHLDTKSRRRKTVTSL